MTDLTPTNVSHSSESRTVTYTAMGASTDGIPFESSKYPDKTVQLFGTFGGTVTIQGTNDPLGLTTPASATWATLTDNLGNALTFTAAGIKLIAENPRFMRAISGSGVTDVDIIFEIARS